jgi:hypothetical protein
MTDESALKAGSWCPDRPNAPRNRFRDRLHERPSPVAGVSGKSRRFVPSLGGRRRLARRTLRPDAGSPPPLRVTWQEIPLDNWVRFWKTRFTRTRSIASQEWQTDHWDTRLRSGESYDGTWLYVRNNPVRARLVGHSDE